KTLIEVARNCTIPIQLGGGVKSLDTIKFYLEEVGIARVIVGTACVSDPNLMDKACGLYGNKIVAGIDVKDGFVAIKGWVEQSVLTAENVALTMKERGVDTVVYTDISRDGALCGVNFKSTASLGQSVGMNIIASGGVASIDDVKNVKQNDIYGVILGKALYDGKIDLAEALALAKSK
ncbi:MAG: HisA/HisF-related TIM barrel protein, partial [Clostridia bacterium]